MNLTILKTEQATIKAGSAFAKKLHGGDVVLLYGELGAGKTTFAKGIAKGLGIKNTITSPTFTLIGVYQIPPRNPSTRRPGRLAQDDTIGAGHQLCHIDTYRLKDVQELRAIGAEDTSAIHSPSRLSSGRKKSRICLRIKKQKQYTSNIIKEGER